MATTTRDKLYESTMQEWFEGLGCIASAIDSIDWDDPLAAGTAPYNGDSAAIRDARRVFDSLYEAGRRSADDNIAQKKGEVFKPDLLLFSECAGAFIIVELKATAAAARQALTEVLGYAEEIRKQTHGTQVFIVIVAHQWNPLLDNAVAAQMRSRHFPLLPLEFYEEDGFHLRLRTEPFRPRPDAIEYFDEHAFRCDTRAYYFQCRDPHLQDLYTANFRIKEEAQHLAARGERTSCSGFVIAWRNAQAWALTTCIFNPALLDLPDTSNTVLGHSGDDWIDMDLGHELLSQVRDMGLPDEYELSGQTGWLNQERALIGDNARLIEVCMWGQQRDSIASFKERLVKETPVRSYLMERMDRKTSVYTDYRFHITRLRHPFIWVPNLYEMMGLSVDMDMPGLSWYYRLGNAIGAAMAYYIGNIKSGGRTSTFGYLAAMGRLLDAWRRVANHAGEGSDTQPPLRFEDDWATLRKHDIDRANIWADEQANRAGKWPAFAHLLGYAHGLTTFKAGESEARKIFYTALNEEVNIKLIRAARAVCAFAKNGNGKELLDYLEHCCREHPSGPTSFTYDSLTFGMTCEVIIALADEWVLFNAADPTGVEFS